LSGADLAIHTGDTVDARTSGIKLESAAFMGRDMRLLMAVDHPPGRHEAGKGKRVRGRA
jgi:hypothetical protein